MTIMINSVVRINLFSLFLAFLVVVIFKLPSLGGAILLVSTVITSTSLDSKKGLICGLINSLASCGLMLVYFKLIHKPFNFGPLFSVIPLFLTGGFFAGRYHEIRLSVEANLKNKVEEKTKELAERIKELEKTREKDEVLRIREMAKTRDIKKKIKELEDSRKALLNILEDVETERKKAEEEKNKTITIIDNLVDGLLVLDNKNRVSLINPQARRFFGIKEKIIGKSMSDLLNFPALKPLIDLISQKTGRVCRKELEVKKDLILEVTVVPLISKRKKIGSIVILHDITREKLIENMKSEFVSISAHQLRTPLSAIKWTLKMLLDGDLGKISPEQRVFIEKTYQSNERMISLINDLLNVSRIEEGRFLYKPVLASLEDVVQSVINPLREKIKRRNIEFKFLKPKEKLPKIKMDVEKMTLAVQNLIENAIRYTKPGGRIVVSLERKGKEVQFQVKDTGVGIPKNQQSRIFSKFFRGGNVIRMETEGSGLGLFITKNIINAHGGKIWFKSEENKGTTFYFTLPIKS